MARRLLLLAITVCAVRSSCRMDVVDCGSGEAMFSVGEQECFQVYEDEPPFNGNSGETDDLSPFSYVEGETITFDAYYDTTSCNGFPDDANTLGCFGRATFELRIQEDCEGGQTSSDPSTIIPIVFGVMFGVFWTAAVVVQIIRKQQLQKQNNTATYEESPPSYGNGGYDGQYNESMGFYDDGARGASSSGYQDEPLPEYDGGRNRGSRRRRSRSRSRQRDPEPAYTYEPAVQPDDEYGDDIEEPSAPPPAAARKRDTIDFDAMGTSSRPKAEAPQPGKFDVYL